MSPANVSGGLQGVPLFWRVFSLNCAVFVLGTAVLALSPATVSSPVLPTEVLVLVIGVLAIMTINAILLRVGLAPLDRLMRLMETIDLLRPGQRLPQSRNGGLAPLVGSFNAMLTRLEMERAASNARALSAQEEERRRIARELHDEIGQSLTAILLELKGATTLAPRGLSEQLHQLQETARASLDDVGRIARRLRPDVLEELGMVPALTALADDFSAAMGIRVHPQLCVDWERLSDEAELVIYRVAQESLTNVARHANANIVEVRLVHDDSDGVLLVVSDDGDGTMQGEGAGIRGMRERALLVGADLRIDSVPGHGTRVTLRIPASSERNSG